jgi:hypothetical protein
VSFWTSLPSGRAMKISALLKFGLNRAKEISPFLPGKVADDGAATIVIATAARTNGRALRVRNLDAFRLGDGPESGVWPTADRRHDAESFEACPTPLSTEADRPEGPPLFVSRSASVSSLTGVALNLCPRKPQVNRRRRPRAPATGREPASDRVNQRPPLLESEPGVRSPFGRAAGASATTATAQPVAPAVALFGSWRIG